MAVGRLLPCPASLARYSLGEGGPGKSVTRPASFIVSHCSRPCVLDLSIFRRVLRSIMPPDSSPTTMGFNDGKTLAFRSSFSLRVRGSMLGCSGASVTTLSISPSIRFSSRASTRLSPIMSAAASRKVSDGRAFFLVERPVQVGASSKGLLGSVKTLKIISSPTTQPSQHPVCFDPAILLSVVLGPPGDGWVVITLGLPILEFPDIVLEIFGEVRFLPGIPPYSTYPPCSNSC